MPEIEASDSEEREIDDIDDDVDDVDEFHHDLPSAVLALLLQRNRAGTVVRSSAAISLGLVAAVAAFGMSADLPGVATALVALAAAALIATGLAFLTRLPAPEE